MSIHKSGVNTPIYRSITHRSPDARDIVEKFVDLPDGIHLYGRFGDPNYDDLRTCLSKMEGGEDAIVFASGMAATFAIFWAKLSIGDHLVVSSRIYGGTRGQVAMMADKLKLRVSVVDITDIAAVLRAVSDDAKMLFVEVVSNPDMIVADISALAKICKTEENDAFFVVDNTFTPLITRPLTMGADVVMHSMTKYVSGRSDGLAGALVGSRTLMKSITHPATGEASFLGATLHAPYAQELADRFDLIECRVREASERAHALAKLFACAGLDVRYPLFAGRPPNLLFGMGREMGGGVFSVAFPSEDSAVLFANRANTMMVREPLVPDHTLSVTAVSLGSSHTYAWCTTEARVQSQNTKWQSPRTFEPVPLGFVRIAVGYGGNRKQLLASFKRLLRELGYQMKPSP